METAGNTVSEIVPSVTEFADDGVVGVSDDRGMVTAPLGVLSGAVVGTVLVSSGC